MSVAGRLKAALDSDTARSLGVLLLQSPALLLADVWYRGVSDDNVYGWLVRRLTDAGLWDETWPAGPVDYVKPWLLVMSMVFVGPAVPALAAMYNPISILLLRQLSFTLCQRYVDDSYGRVIKEDDSLSGFCEIPSHPFLIDHHSSTDTLICLPDEQPSPSPGFMSSLAVGVLHLVAQWIIGSLINGCLNSLKLLNGYAGLLQRTQLLTVILCIVGVPGWITRMVNVVVCTVDVLILLVTDYILSTVLWIAWTISLLIYVGQLTAENRSKVFVSWIVLCAVQAAVRWQLDEDVEAGDFLLNLLVDTTSSPFGFIGLCAAVAFFSKAVYMVVYAWLNATMAWPQVDTTGGCVAESERVLLAGFVLYATGLSSSPSFPIVVVAGVLASILTLRLFLLAEPVLLNPERGRHWMQLRAMTIYALVAAFPMYSTYRVWAVYELVSWEFVFLAPTVAMSMSAVGSLVKRVVYVIDDWSPSGQFEDLDEVIRQIGTITMTANGIISACILCLTVAMLLISNCTSWALLCAASQCYLNLYRPYIAFREANTRRRRVAELIASMPAPSGGDRRLDDVCPICYADIVTSMVPGGDVVQLVTACVLTPCGHIYHRRCLTKWMLVRTVCPTCHTDLNMENHESDQQQTTLEYVAALMWARLRNMMQLVRNAFQNDQRNNDVVTAASS